MDDHVYGLRKDARSRGGDGDAPGRVFCADDFAEIAADFRGVFVDGADDFERVFLAHQANDGSADGADTELNYADFLTHRAVLERKMGF